MAQTNTPSEYQAHIKERIIINDKRTNPNKGDALILAASCISELHEPFGSRGEMGRFEFGDAGVFAHISSPHRLGTVPKRGFSLVFDIYDCVSDFWQEYKN